MKRQPMTVQLSEDARRLLAELALQLGVSKSAVIEVAIREKAQRVYDDSWAYTPEFRARIERARKSPDVPGVTEEDLEAVIAADDPQKAVQELIARRLSADGLGSVES